MLIAFCRLSNIFRERDKPKEELANLQTDKEKRKFENAKFLYASKQQKTRLLLLKGLPLTSTSKKKKEGPAQRQNPDYSLPTLACCFIWPQGNCQQNEKTKK